MTLPAVLDSTCAKGSQLDAGQQGNLLMKPHVYKESLLRRRAASILIDRLTELLEGMAAQSAPIKFY